MEGRFQGALADTVSDGIRGILGIRRVFQSGVSSTRDATFALRSLARPRPAPGTPWGELWESLAELWDTSGSPCGHVGRKSGLFRENEAPAGMLVGNPDFSGEKKPAGMLTGNPDFFGATKAPAGMLAGNLDFLGWESGLGTTLTGREPAIFTKF